MLSLRSYLSEAPKPLLREIHGRLRGTGGLVQNDRVLSEAIEAAADPDRIDAVRSSLSATDLRILRALYHSGERGLGLREIQYILAPQDRPHTGSHLARLCDHLFCFRRRNETQIRYQGFLELRDFFTSHDHSTELSAGTWSECPGFLLWHLSLFVGSVASGKGRVNSDGELHKRFLTQLGTQIRHHAQLSAQAAEDEIHLLYTHLLSVQALSAEDGILFLEPQWRDSLLQETDGYSLWIGIVRNWLSGGGFRSIHDLRNFLGTFHEPLGMSEALLAAWTRQPSQRPPKADAGSCSWEDLTPAIRDLWLFGLLRLRLERGRITAVQISEWASDWVMREQVVADTAGATCTPGFEVAVPLNSPPWLLFTLSWLSEPLDDDHLIRFPLQKPKVEDAIRGGWPVDKLGGFLTAIRAPSNIRATLAEWCSTFTGAEIDTVRLLRIQDPGRRSELSAFVPFRACTREEIPGVGFILEPTKEAEARHLLSNFGLEPLQETPASARHPQLPPPIQPALPAEGEIIWKAHSSESTMSNVATGTTKYGGHFQQLDLPGMIHVLRYALTTESMVEAKLKALPKGSPEQVLFQVRELRIRKEPYTLKAIPHPQGADIDLELGRIEAIRIATPEE